MSPVCATPTRFIGLDIHKHYLVAVGVDGAQQMVFGPQRIAYTHLTAWIEQHLTLSDAVVLEMTTNAFQIHDELLPHVQSVLVVHPQHVALVTQVPVKTDTKAALTLAQLLAAGLLKGVWVPPPPVRDLRTLVIQRQKLRRLATQARNRLHAALHRARIVPPTGNLFAPTQHAWWQQLPVSVLEQARIQSDLATFTFAEAQVAQLEDALAAAAATDARVPLLIQLPGIQLVAAVTLLAAIGDIRRFPTAQQLVGYAGLGARIHDSGQVRRTGRITKAGRRDLRYIMVEAAHSASRWHGHWRAEFTRLRAHVGHRKALVAIARKLLVVVWHVLTHETADRHAEPYQVARSFMVYGYRLGREHRPDGQSVPQLVRAQLDRLGIGADLTTVAKGPSTVLRLPPSSVPTGS
jgi:transposase